MFDKFKLPIPVAKPVSYVLAWFVLVGIFYVATKFSDWVAKMTPLSDMQAFVAVLFVIAVVFALKQRHDSLAHTTNSTRKD